MATSSSRSAFVRFGPSSTMQQQLVSFLMIFLLLSVSLLVAPATAATERRQQHTQHHHHPAAANGGSNSRKPPPIIGEESSGKNRRSADCHFGKKVYELEETWHPDLGSPFGVMYCIRCECMAVQKKRRIAGRTLCRNIKNECPKPTCDEPVLLPGRCCKVCLDTSASAGGVGQSPLKEDVSRLGTFSSDYGGVGSGYSTADDYADDKAGQFKDFAAVLTLKKPTTVGATDYAAGGSSASTQQQQQQQQSSQIMATGRFTFHKRHLYFSIVIKSAVQQQQQGDEEEAPVPPVLPRYLQFLSSSTDHQDGGAAGAAGGGNILEEQELTLNDYYNATGKICGVWRKVPRIYKQLLRDEKIWVALLDDKSASGGGGSSGGGSEGAVEALTGRIGRYSKALSTELLSAVLTVAPSSPSSSPSSLCGGGGGGGGCPAGTAALSIASASNSVHLTVAVSGLLQIGSGSSSSNSRAVGDAATAAAAAAIVETLVVRLETVEADAATGSPRVIEELVTVQKPQEVNVVEVRTVLETPEMRLLMRAGGGGGVQLSVYSKRAPNVRLSGIIGPRIACDLFDSPLLASGAATTTTSTSSTDAAATAASLNSSTSFDAAAIPISSASAMMPPPVGAGLAWMYIGRDAGVHYRIKLQGLSSPITRVTIESSSTSSSSSSNKQSSSSSSTNKAAVIRIIEDITANVAVRTDNQNQLVAWVNGTVARLSAKDLELLYEGELYVNVATQLRPQTEIRGRIVQRLAGEAQRAAILESGPVLLLSSNNNNNNNNNNNLQQQPSTSQNRAALGWVHVDNECNFHYDVSVTSGINGAAAHHGGGGGWWSSSSSSNSGSSRSRDAHHHPNSFTVLELVDIPRLSVDVHHHHHQQLSSPSSGDGAGGSGIMLMDGTATDPASGGSNTYGEVPYLPNIRILEEFSGYQVENMLTDLNKLSLARMDAGVAYLKLTESPAIGMGIGSGSGSLVPPAQFQFQGWLTNVHVPDACLPYGFKQQQMSLSSTMNARGGGGGGEGAEQQQQQRSDDPLLLMDPDSGGPSSDNNEIPPVLTTRCFYEGRLFEDGSAWTALHDRCMMCSCQRGRVVCDPVVCPSLAQTCSATTSVIVHQPGDCCPICQVRSNVTSAAPASASPSASSSAATAARRGCHFDGDQKFHAAGSRWHPYLPPFGFSKCAVCVCDAVTLKVECTKLTCPALVNCSESEAYRPDPMACCKQCPTPTATPSITPSPVAAAAAAAGLLGEEAQARGEADVLASGGCRFKGDVFENGEEWHPRIQPWGEMKCINCNCKDGKVKCKRRKCGTTSSKTRCSSSSSSVMTTSAATSVDECCPSHTVMCHQQQSPEEQHSGQQQQQQSSSSTSSSTSNSNSNKSVHSSDSNKKQQQQHHGTTATNNRQQQQQQQQQQHKAGGGGRSRIHRRQVRHGVHHQHHHQSAEAATAGAD